jgi:7-carboxy-7-deazaguanine synthase (Cx14CxxC type)
MTYAVKEIFYTLQGEGAQTGRAAVFCRFAGCNLWSGREEDRASAICQFCDTDFADTNGPGGGKFGSADALAAAIEGKWLVVASDRKFVVCTGGEPLLQLDLGLIEALHERGFEIAVETNGTVKAPDGIDWICVSSSIPRPEPSRRDSRRSRFAISSFNQWTGPAAKRTRNSRCDIVLSIPNGASACRRTSCWGFRKSREQGAGE